MAWRNHATHKLIKFTIRRGAAEYGRAYAVDYNGEFYATDAPAPQDILYFLRTGYRGVFQYIKVETWEKAKEKAKELASKEAKLRQAEVASWQGDSFGLRDALR